MQGQQTDTSSGGGGHGGGGHGHGHGHRRDRNSGIKYSIKSYNAQTKVFGVTGTWEQGTGFTACTKGSANCASFVYNVELGKSKLGPPSDTVTCPEGSKLVWTNLGG